MILLERYKKIISAMVSLVQYTKICYSGHNMILLARYTKNHFSHGFPCPIHKKFVTRDTTWFCMPDTQKIISAMVLLVPFTKKICYLGHNMILLAWYTKNHFHHGFTCPIHKKIVTRDTTLHPAPYPPLSPLISAPPSPHDVISAP